MKLGVLKRSFEGKMYLDERVAFVLKRESQECMCLGAVVIGQL